MSTEKLSELSKPVAWLAIYHGDVYDEAISITRSVVEAQADRFGWESALTEITPLYSQEYVSALLAELEAKDERIGELEVIATEYAGKFQKAQDANKHLIIMSNDDKKRIAELERANQSQDDHINQQQDRIDSLEKKNGDLGRSLGAAEKRLATPVQLQNCDFESVAIMAHWCTDEQLKAWVKGVEHAKKQIRAAGFTVGDE